MPRMNLKMEKALHKKAKMNALSLDLTLQEFVIGAIEEKICNTQ